MYPLLSRVDVSKRDKSTSKHTKDKIAWQAGKHEGRPSTSQSKGAISKHVLQKKKLADKRASKQQGGRADGHCFSDLLMFTKNQQSVATCIGLRKQFVENRRDPASVALIVDYCPTNPRRTAWRNAHSGASTRLILWKTVNPSTSWNWLKWDRDCWPNRGQISRTTSECAQRESNV